MYDSFSEGSVFYGRGIALMVGMTALAMLLHVL